MGWEWKSPEYLCSSSCFQDPRAWLVLITIFSLPCCFGIVRTPSILHPMSFHCYHGMLNSNFTKTSQRQLREWTDTES
ncbi:hypothetical protein DL98DRAFT_223 [Cadophora sp. DSE1049]|nr:hypothetical protein DL98DRAFT_223 [Cadophora sp. DSE1049]